MCLAALTESSYQKISTAYRIDSEKAATHIQDEQNTLPTGYPWPEFPEDVFRKTEEILVYHSTRRNETKQTRKKVHLVTPYRRADGKLIRVVKTGGDTVRGQLHKDSYFGRILDPESGEERSVIRKELNLNNFAAEAKLSEIVDPKIRESVQEQIRSRMKEGKSFKDAMNEGNFRMWTRDGSFNGPPILSVRCFVRITDPLKIRKHAYSSDKEYKKYIYKIFSN